ncbi:MAG: acetyl-CoA hydrolase/transferase C-terminal domain-containing protein [Pseudomonadota bacterium]
MLTGSSHGIIIGVAPRPKSGRASSTLGITRARWAPHSAYGKSVHQRADALIGLAHPKFRDELANSLR